MSIKSKKTGRYAGMLSGVAIIAMLVSGAPAIAAEPIVILEYNRSSGNESDYDGTHPFRMDPNYSAHHKVQPNETLSHVMANYYGGSGLDFGFVQMAIIKKNKSAFVRQNPHYMFANVNLHLPSVNEIRAMITKSAAAKSVSTPAYEPHNEIYFFGG